MTCFDLCDIVHFTKSYLSVGYISHQSKVEVQSDKTFKYSRKVPQSVLKEIYLVTLLMKKQVMTGWSSADPTTCYICAMGLI